MADRRKPKNFRRKGDDASDDSKPDKSDKPKFNVFLDSAPAITTQDTRPVAKPAAPPPKPKPVSLLSFEQETETEIIVKKKPPTVATGHAHKKKPTKTRDEVPSFTVQATSGEYTREKLQELRKNAMHFASGIPEPTPAPPEPASSTVNAAERKTPTAEESDEAAMILAVKKKRERIRAASSSDYIPLKENKYERFRGIDAAPERPRMEEPEEAPAMKARERMGSEVEVQDADNDEEEDEEVRWEMEQIRKGMRKPLQSAAMGATPGTSAAPPGADITGLRIDSSSGRSPPVSGGGALPYGLGPPPAQQPPVDPKQIQGSVRKSLESMKSKNSKNQKQLEKVKDDLGNATNKITDWKEDLSRATDQYSFFQDLKVFLDDLLDCLADKGPAIQELQNTIQMLRTQRAQAYFKRRELEVEDGVEEVNEVAGIPTVTDPKKKKSIEEEDEDEFGRDRSHYLKASRARRKEDRKRRREKMKARKEAEAGETEKQKQSKAESALEEMLLTDDESDTEVERFNTEYGTLAEQAKGVFADTVEEFGNVSHVKRRLEKWKETYPKAYSDAYVSLSLPSLMTPYVRQQLLLWDPLSVPSFDKMRWYNDLFDYGINVPESKDDDPDLNLVPRLVEKVALPIVKTTVQNVWDPWSRRQTSVLLALIQELLIYVDAQSSDMKTLFETVLNKLMRSVESCVVPAYSFLGGEQRGAPAAAEAVQFCEEQFWSAVKLLKNVCAWHDLLSRSALEAMSTDILLEKRLVPFLRERRNNTAIITMSEKIVEAFPPEWSLTAQSPSIKAFRSFLIKLSTSLQQQQKESSPSPSSSENALLAPRLSKLLTRLDAKDEAQKLTKAFAIKIRL